MLKPKTYNVAETNIANLGSDLEKNVRQAAAETEAAWTGVGKAPGLVVFRIEKFQVKAYPKEDYGKFFSGDSYIVLNTYKKKDGNALQHDVHFWLGANTTQDEAGTAAYKTVELDDLLGGVPVQHREVQDYESDLFLSYFNPGVQILAGGVDTGFKHVEPTKYQPRLLHVKGRAQKVRVSQVNFTVQSLNAGDVFVLDAGKRVVQFNGKSANPFEKNKAAELVRSLDDERGGVDIHVYDQGSSPGDFFTLLGGGSEADIKPAEAGGSDKSVGNEKKLYRVSDASGKLEFTEIASGAAVKRDKLDSNDAFVLDAGYEVFVFVGLKASTAERKKSLQLAQDYLLKNNREPNLPISRILEGGENEAFLAAFN